MMLVSLAIRWKSVNLRLYLRIEGGSIGGSRGLGSL